MPAPPDQSSSPNESGSKRASFSISGSLSGSFGSVRRALSREGKISGNSARHDKEAEGLAESLTASNPFADPPPAYTTTAAGNSGGSSGHGEHALAGKPPSRVESLYTRLRGPNSTAEAEANKFRFLAEFDTVFLIDDSSSMKWNDRGDATPRRGGLSRWEQTRNVIEQIVPTCMAYDQDGVDIYFLNDPYQTNVFGNHHGNEPGWRQAGDPNQGKASHAYIGVGNPNVVRNIFHSRRPMLGTPTGARLGQMMDTYVECYARRAASSQPPPKPLNIIVITDGEANDRETLRGNLIRTAEQLDALCAPYHQLGVQFFQVGKDEGAARYLRDLDDGLGNYRSGKELRDIVDCVTHEQLSGETGSQLSADVVLKVVLGAVNKHLDNQKIREGVLIQS